MSRGKGFRRSRRLIRAHIKRRSRTLPPVPGRSGVWGVAMERGRYLGWVKGLGNSPGGDGGAVRRDGTRVGTRRSEWSIDTWWEYGAGGGGIRRNFYYPFGIHNLLSTRSTSLHYPRRHGPCCPCGQPSFHTPSETLSALRDGGEGRPGRGPRRPGGERTGNISGRRYRYRARRWNRG